MKKGNIDSAILGGAFFAVPYLVINVPLLPATIMGVAAFGAGNLIFSDKKEKGLDLKIGTENLYEILNDAKAKNIELREMSKKLEDKELVKNVQEIYSCSVKIVDTISKKPEKLQQAHNFLNYYLPVTIKILQKYDEIENQRLTSNESKTFMENTRKMVEKIKSAFEVQLSNLYQSEMLDTDAEIKVFETMLKTDGFTEIGDFDIKGDKK